MEGKYRGYGSRTERVQGGEVLRIQSIRLAQCNAWNAGRVWREGGREGGRGDTRRGGIAHASAVGRPLRGVHTVGVEYTERSRRQGARSSFFAVD